MVSDSSHTSPISGPLSEFLLAPRHASVLTFALTALYALLDFWVPGALTVAILYASSVVVSGWTRSVRFLWGTTLVCLALTYSGLAFGPQPPADMLLAFYINRSFVALGLVLIAALVQERLRMIDGIEQTRDALIRQNQKLADVELQLRRAKDGLEIRVEQEVGRRLKAEQELQQVQKLESIGQLAGGIAHDFNNILSTVIGNVEMIRARLPEDDRCRRFAENALLGAKQGASFTKQLLAFARSQPLEPEVVEIDSAVDEVITLARHVMPPVVELSCELKLDVWRTYVDRSALQSALLNLMINARDAMPDGGRITFSDRNVVLGPDNLDVAGGDYVRLTVGDTGCGMTSEVMARAFEPFFTTKASGKGTGLGLSMVHGFAKQCGGTVRIESGLGRGTDVHLYLPRSKHAEIVNFRGG